MADPFDIPDVVGHEEEEEAQGEQPQGAFDIPDVAPEQDAGAPPESHDAEDVLLSLIDGITLNNAGEIGDSLGMLGIGGEDDIPEHQVMDGMKPTYSGPRNPDMEQVYRDARKSTAGQVAHGAGLVGSGVGAALAAGPGVVAQGLAGAATGALSAGGDTEYDPLATLAGGGTGAAFGLAGGALGKGVDAVRKWLGGSPAGALIGDTNAEVAKRALAIDPIADSLSTIGSKATKRAALGAAEGVSGALPRGVAGAASAGAGQAYAGMPTLSWGVQSVLSSGRSKLPPEAEQQLTEAVLSGDDSKVIATNFKLQQRYPGYAKRLQDEIDSLNSGV